MGRERGEGRGQRGEGRGQRAEGRGERGEGGWKEERIPRSGGDERG